MTPTLVIERPDLQAWRQKYGYAVLTFAFWGLYLYLWQPLLSLVLWSFGLGLAYEEMLHLGGFRGLLDLLVFYAGIICAMSAVFLGWGWINYLRFRGVDRRQAAPAVSPRELTEFFKEPLNKYQKWLYSVYTNRLQTETRPLSPFFIAHGAMFAPFGVL